MRMIGARILLGLIAALAATGTALAAGSAPLGVSATVLSKSICKFNSASAALSFGTLNAATPVDVTTSATLDFRCIGSAPIATYFVSDDDGLYETGPDLNRMRHATVTTQYLPYSLSLSPASSTVPKNTVQPLTITGTVRGVDYQTIYPGNYADTVVISITP